MTIIKLLRFLIGDKQVIADVAGARGLWVVGVMMTFGACLLFLTDRVYLLGHPIVSMMPFWAPVMMAFVMFVVVRIVLRPRPGVLRNFWRDALVYQTLFMMCSPLLWLIALPYDRLIPDAYIAAVVQYSVLAVVVLWHAWLMIRITCVITGSLVVGAFFAVTVVYAMPIGLIGEYFSLESSPLFAGGLVTRREEFIQSALSSVGGLFVLPNFGLIGLLISFFASEARWIDLEPRYDEGQLPSWGLKRLAGAMVLVALVYLPVSQPEQAFKERVVRESLSNGLRREVVLLNVYSQRQLPPHWRFVVRSDTTLPRQSKMSIGTSVRWQVPRYLGDLKGDDIQPWVREMFVEDFELRLEYMSTFFAGSVDWYGVEYVLHTMPEGLGIAKRLKGNLELVLAIDDGLTDYSKRLIKSIIELANGKDLKEWKMMKGYSFLKTTPDPFLLGVLPIGA